MGGRAYSSSSSSSSSSRSYRVTRTESPGFSVPYYGPSPFGGAAGVYVGPAVGVGSSFFFVMMGFAAFFLVSGFLSDRSGEGVLTATEKISVLKLQVRTILLCLTNFCLYLFLYVKNVSLMSNDKMKIVSLVIFGFKRP